MHPLGYLGIAVSAKLEEKFYSQSQSQLADLIESLGMQVCNCAPQNHIQDIIDDHTLSHMTNAELLAWLKVCVARLEELDLLEGLAVQRKTVEELIDRSAEPAPLDSINPPVDMGEFIAVAKEMRELQQIYPLVGQNVKRLGQLESKFDAWLRVL
jgi:hypothetical protein